MPANKPHQTESNSLTGILVLDKPAGISSMQAVAAVRRRAGGAKTGHAGTLDPLATGVLVMAIGRATRLIEQLMATSKRYQTVIDLSAFTTTDDAEGDRMPVQVASAPREEQVREAVASMSGEIMQQPPAFSAVKIGGKRAYKLARQGNPVAIPPRLVQLYSARLVEYNWPNAEVELYTGKGFYVRSFARDLGRSLKTGGYCTALRRTAVGPFNVDQAITLDALPDQLTHTDLLAPDTAVELAAAHQQAMTASQTDESAEHIAPS